jgi:tetratricopeptide (TPR) repeat protein
MSIISAFIGRSFIKEDEPLWAEIAKFLNSLSKVGFSYEDAEESQAKPISDKVKEKIARNDIFIGVLTKREPIFDKPVFSFGKYHLVTNPFNWTSSYWVIQESGYAIGMKKKVIFLTEDGLTMPGGLNADFEYVTIYKTNISDTFIKLNQIITNEIGAKLKYIEEQPVSRSVEIIAPEQTTVHQNQLPVVEENSLSWGKFFNALEKKDFPDAEKQFNNLLEQNQFNDQVFAKAFFNKELYFAGKSDAFQELKSIADSNPEDVNIIELLVDCLQLYDKHKDARDLIENYLEKNSNYDKKIKLAAILSSIYIKIKDFEKSRRILYPFLENENTNNSEQNFALYKSMGDVYKDQGELDISCTLYENALNHKPTDLSLRFKLAVDYDEIKKYALSVYHYKSYLKTSKDSGVINNLGVEYSHLKILGKSSQSYKKAIELNNTLASANLSQIYIDSGLYDEANIILSKAIEKDNHHENVDYFLNQLKTMIERENKEDLKLSKDTNEYRDFIFNFAKAISSPLDRYEEINGLWAANYGEVKEFIISIELPNIIKGIYQLDYVYPSKTGLAAAAYTLRSGGEGMLSENRTKETKISGTLINKGLKYKIKINTNSKKTTTLLGGGDNIEFSGYGIISADNRGIDFVVEKDGTFEYFTALKRN